MRRAVILALLMMSIASLKGQKNLEVDRFLLLKAIHERDHVLETHIVPVGEVWKIESVICHREAETVNLRIDGISYIIGAHEEEKIAPQLPFYLPEGTEFKLWTTDNYPGLVSICVLRIVAVNGEQTYTLNIPGSSTLGNEDLGVAREMGNQGDPIGSPDAVRYGTVGGPGNQLYSYGLGSRKSRGAWPLPDMSGCEVTSKITIRVEIQVDREGNVVGTPVVLEATYQNKCIWDTVIEAAKKSKFTADQAAAYRQKGWIRYVIGS